MRALFDLYLLHFSSLFSLGCRVLMDARVTLGWSEAGVIFALGKWVYGYFKPLSTKPVIS
jgi:hypothetical protein